MLAAARRAGLRGAGAARRVYRQAILEGRFDPSSLGLSEEAALDFARTFSFELPTVAEVLEEDGPLGRTAKAALALADGLRCECVHIPMGRGRHTLCISSQVGCKMGCAFCETGTMGLVRSMRVEEIVGQILVARHRLGWSFRNIVFMGMGEALDNADGLIEVLRILNDTGGLRISQERITVCTVGRIEGIRRLSEAGFRRLNLSISLNASTDEKRDRLMPVNRVTKLAELQATLLDYRPRANFAFGVNYCLLPGINDAREDASGVARFCEPLGRVLVNVIPYNPGRAALTRPPTEVEVERFIGWLRDEGLPVRRRVTKGRSVMAACGQLGDPTLSRKGRRSSDGASSPSDLSGSAS